MSMPHFPGSVCEACGRPFGLTEALITGTALEAYPEENPALEAGLPEAKDRALSTPPCPDLPPDVAGTLSESDKNPVLELRTLASNLITGNRAKGIIELAIKCGALKFGAFTLKSGRVSPYFMNFGSIHSGDDSETLGYLYGAEILESFRDSEGKDAFNVIFGPAYKGIPLAVHAAAALSHGMSVPWAFDRKEAKDHGEGGRIVGADVRGKRVLIVDDVLTAGTAIGEAVKTITEAGGIPVGAVVAFDRMEKAKDSDFSAVQLAREKYGIPVVAIATLGDLLEYLEADPKGLTPEVPVGEITEGIKEYRRQYGADYSTDGS